MAKAHPRSFTIGAGRGTWVQVGERRCGQGNDDICDENLRCYFLYVKTAAIRVVCNKNIKLDKEMKLAHLREI